MSALPIICGELAAQQARFVPSALRERHLDALRRGASAVVTGQQAGLFVGPALGIYKAATAIVEARRRDAVPVFWLQAEDHDGDEVKSCAVLDGEGELRRLVLPPTGGDRVALAHRSLPDHTGQALTDLAAALEAAPSRESCLAWLRRSYRGGAGWVDAFAAALAELFADEGLLVLQPRTPAIAELARPVHRFAIEQADAIDALLARHSGDSPQVRLRPGCLLSFHHPEGAEGPRYRPVRRDGGYAWPGGDPVSHAELLARLERAPSCFSTSALLRPLLQDQLLPTAAYVAGPSEARYLEQVRPIHAAFGLTMPDVVARARFVVTDARCRRALAALQLTAASLERAEIRPAPAGAPDIRAELLDPLLARIDALAPAIVAIDPGLARSIERTRRHLTRGIERLGERVAAAAVRREHAADGRLAELRRRLMPEGAPQERVLSFANFAAWHGIEEVKRAVLEAAGRGAVLQELAL